MTLIYGIGPSRILSTIFTGIRLDKDMFKDIFARNQRRLLIPDTIRQYREDYVLFLTTIPDLSLKPGHSFQE
jgi:hypothetical protein